MQELNVPCEGWALERQVCLQAHCILHHIKGLYCSKIQCSRDLKQKAQEPESAGSVRCTALENVKGGMYFGLLTVVLLLFLLTESSPFITHQSN